jgi:hypothetical protein
MLVDQKLAEVAAPPLSEQSAAFGLTPERRRTLDAVGRRELQAVVRLTEDVFDLDAMLADFDALWGKRA